jgi:2-polyprenyl-3-methyl-5-hydroxy-6-metoxy-1,4-benzoquinol methylase
MPSKRDQATPPKHLRNVLPFSKSTLDLQGMDDAGTKRRIISAYHDPIIRLYCRIRFEIINSRFLEEIVQHLPPEASILDIGCGFGLFSCYFASSDPASRVQGIDVNERRIKTAQGAAERLNLENVSFRVADAETYQFEDQFDAITVLDLLHHVERGSADRLVAAGFEHLKAGGVLILKDVNVLPVHKMLFTYALDKVMDFRRPVHYRSVFAWRELLLRVGFSRVYYYYLDDYLPYPHILLICHKA